MFYIKISFNIANSIYAILQYELLCVLKIKNYKCLPLSHRCMDKNYKHVTVFLLFINNYFKTSKCILKSTVLNKDNPLCTSVLVSRKTLKYQTLYQIIPQIVYKIKNE